MADQQKIIQTFETVDFPDYGLEGVVAKIDTGAYTGALHCTKISLEPSKQGDILTFSPFDHPETTISTQDYVIAEVKSSNGDVQDRFFIRTHMVVQGEQYEIQLSLADRSEMRWPVLIGRKFLRKNKFLVDVNRASDIVT
jgi:hypothetical protein